MYTSGINKQHKDSRKFVDIIVIPVSALEDKDNSANVRSERKRVSLWEGDYSSTALPWLDTGGREGEEKVRLGGGEAR